MLNRLSLCIGLVLLVCSHMAIADNVEAILFKDTEEVLKKANEVQANILAPKAYAEASRHFNDAKKKLAKGQKLDKIKKYLAEAKENYQKAIDASELAVVTFQDALLARNNAVKAEANEFAPDEWARASEEFAAAAERLESGYVKGAQKQSKKAKTLFEDAELAAVKNHYLDNTRQLVEKAKEVKAHKFAPLTLAKAEELLLQAEQALNANRYDVDEPRSLARHAMYEAGHAINIALQVKSLSSKDLTEEELILKMESLVVNIAESLDQAALFDGSVEDPTAVLVKAIQQLKSESFELNEKTNEIMNLEQAMAELEAKLGVQSDRLAKQETRRRKIEEVEALFSEQEAVVLKKGDSIIIRMVGLNFKSGKSNIDAEYFNLLRKVKSAMDIFPYAHIVVEGHTDSFGGDDLNMSLSQERAQSVKSYLQANSDTSLLSRISAEGYGETRPIGNNESVDGRRKNRRIDLIIKD